MVGFMKRKWWMVALILLCLVAVPAYFYATAQPAGAQAAAPKAEQKAAAAPAAATAPAPAAAPAPAKPAAKIDYQKAWTTIAILAVAFLFFMTELIPLEATAILVPVALVVSGVLRPADAFKDFANQWTLIFMFMFMMGEALFRTGFADKVGRWAVEKGKGREKLVMLNVMIVAAALSSVLSNTGTTVCFLPIVLGVVTLAGFSTRGFMMALAFATSFGGTLTLIGTPPNGVVNGVLGTAKMPTFGFFEFALIGFPIAVAGIATFMLFGTRFLPKGKVDQSAEGYSGPEAAADFKYRTNKMGVAVGIFAFVVAVMALGDFVPFIKKTLNIDLLTAAALGAALMIITKCITWKEAWQSVSWQTIFLFACMFPVSTALEKTGGVLMIAQAVNDLVAGSPMGLMIGMTVLTALLTQFASNTATALIVGPIGLASAVGMGISPLPILMGIGMGASLCFLTPIATPPNTIVLGPGQLKFIDYIKAGLIPQLVCTILVIILVPLIWPFRP